MSRERDAMAAMATRWDARADEFEAMRAGDSIDRAADDARADTLRNCADELRQYLTETAR